MHVSRKVKTTYEDRGMINHPGLLCYPTKQGRKGECESCGFSFYCVQFYKFSSCFPVFFFSNPTSNECAGKSRAVYKITGKRERERECVTQDDRYTESIVHVGWPVPPLRD